jgi:curli biogenesis system outer membrane secretion channel CsgG
MRKFTSAVAVLAIVFSIAAPVAPAYAQYGMDKKGPKNAATPELPHCDRPLGTAAIQEPENRWWLQYNLSSPEVLIKLFASRSGCFRIVDRNGGLAMRGQEKELSEGGDLQRGSNIGRGQVKAADFFIVPDIANSNENSGGNNIGAVAGSFLPGGFGALAGSLKTKKMEAQVLLTLVDARTTEQLYVAEGVAQKTDISFGAGAGAFGMSGFGGLAGGGYGNTDIGKVITAAYFNAFVDLVHYVQSGQAPTGEEAKADAGPVAQKVTQDVQLRQTPAPTGRIVLTLHTGALVYPTGGRNGVWMEVDDENGNRGWMSSAYATPR